MNKFLSCMILLSLLLSLCSCSEKPVPAPDPAEPQSMPDLESIIEPLTDEESSAAAETEAARSDESQDMPDATSGPISEAERSSSVTSAPQPVVPPQTETPPKAETPEPELFGAVAPDTRLDSEAIEKELLRLINALRDEAGVNALGIEDSMQFAARIRAAEALESFSHTRTDGTPYNTAFDEAGFSYAGKLHGENLSSLSFSAGTFNEKEIALEMFKGLKNSPGHYRNMAEKNFVQAGIGVAVTYAGDVVAIASAQMFSGL